MTKNFISLTKDEQVSALADAMYSSSVNAAIDSINKIEISFDEFPDIFVRLLGESLAAQILIFSSFIENKLFELIKLRLFDLKSKSEERRMFAGNGPFSNFEGRIFLSYHLGWLTSNQAKKLNAFRKMRNEFAHNAFKTNFEDPKIQGFIKSMDYDLEEYLRPARSKLIEDGSDLFLKKEDISIEREFLANLSILAYKTFLDYLVLPAALEHRVSPNDIAGVDFDAQPIVTKEIIRKHSKVLLVLLGKN